MAYATDFRAARFPLMARLSGLRAELAERARKNRVYRDTLNELAVMTDRDLADIGISRSMIKGVALEAAKRA
ncbi:DUF1127 domain-containing protein [Marivivens marinus]|uniref:DUF1127 domain-containing protein n=1 Tax=Marivivens marinus TaxID=3110173 RepID=UPI003B84AA76